MVFVPAQLPGQTSGEQSGCSIAMNALGFSEMLFNVHDSMDSVSDFQMCS